jgi:hypothetical protein
MSDALGKRQRAGVAVVKSVASALLLPVMEVQKFTVWLACASPCR